MAIQRQSIVFISGQFDVGVTDIEPSMLIKINVSLACIICLFMGLILFFLNTNKKESQRMKLIFIVVMVVVLSTLVLTAIFM